MQPTEPAAIASMPAPPRSLPPGWAVAFVVLASLGIAWMASWFAYYGRVSYLDGKMPFVGALCLSLAALMLGEVLDHVGAHGASRLLARALALAPVWAATLFFTPVGALLIAVVVVALVGASNVARRSWVALAGIALLWTIPLPSAPVDVDEAPLVQSLVSHRPR